MVIQIAEGVILGIFGAGIIAITILYLLRLGQALGEGIQEWIYVLEEPASIRITQTKTKIFPFKWKHVWFIGFIVVSIIFALWMLTH
jgi:hypothetical protein